MFAFSECAGLTSFIIPTSVKSIGDFTFQHCTNLKSVTIPNSVITIGEFAFQKCKSLESVIIPESVTSVGVSAFLECTALTSVTFGKSIKIIGDSSFASCENIKVIYNKIKSPLKCMPLFPDIVLNKAELYVPKGTLASYQEVEPWKNFKNIREMKF